MHSPPQAKRGSPRSRNLENVGSPRPSISRERELAVATPRGTQPEISEAQGRLGSSLANPVSNSITQSCMPGTASAYYQAEGSHEVASSTARASEPGFEGCLGNSGSPGAPRTFSAGHNVNAATPSSASSCSPTSCGSDLAPPVSRSSTALLNPAYLPRTPPRRDCVPVPPLPLSKSGFATGSAVVPTITGTPSVSLPGSNRGRGGVWKTGTALGQYVTVTNTKSNILNLQNSVCSPSTASPRSHSQLSTAQQRLLSAPKHSTAESVELPLREPDGKNLHAIQLQDYNVQTSKQLSGEPLGKVHHWNTPKSEHLGRVRFIASQVGCDDTAPSTGTRELSHDGRQALSSPRSDGTPSLDDAPAASTLHSSAPSADASCASNERDSQVLSSANASELRGATGSSSVTSTACCWVYPSSHPGQASKGVPLASPSNSVTLKQCASPFAQTGLKLSEAQPGTDKPPVSSTDETSCSQQQRQIIPIPLTTHALPMHHPQHTMQSATHVGGPHGSSVASAFFGTHSFPRSQFYNATPQLPSSAARRSAAAAYLLTSNQTRPSHSVEEAQRMAHSSCVASATGSAFQFTGRTDSPLENSGGGKFGVPWGVQPASTSNAASQTRSPSRVPPSRLSYGVSSDGIGTLQLNQHQSPYHYAPTLSPSFVRPAFSISDSNKLALFAQDQAPVVRKHPGSPGRFQTVGPGISARFLGSFERQQEPRGMKLAMPADMANVFCSLRDDGTAVPVPPGCCAVCWLGNSDVPNQQVPTVLGSPNQLPKALVNDLTHCFSCGLAVHRLCYGLSPNSATRWFCSVCEYWSVRHLDEDLSVAAAPPVENSERFASSACDDANEATKHDERNTFRGAGLAKPRRLFSPCCVLCNRPGGALRIGPEHLWVHVSCVLYCVEGPSFALGFRLQRPVGVKRYLALHRLKNFRCCLCKSSRGFTVRCGYPDCVYRVHISCAFSARLLPQLRWVFSKRSGCEKLIKVVACPLHCHPAARADVVRYHLQLYDDAELLGQLSDLHAQGRHQHHHHSHRSRHKHHGDPVAAALGRASSKGSLLFHHPLPSTSANSSCGLEGIRRRGSHSSGPPASRPHELLDPRKYPQAGWDMGRQLSAARTPHEPWAADRNSGTTNLTASSAPNALSVKRRWGTPAGDLRLPPVSTPPQRTPSEFRGGPAWSGASLSSTAKEPDGTLGVIRSQQLKPEAQQRKSFKSKPSEDGAAFSSSDVPSSSAYLHGRNVKLKKLNRQDRRSAGWITESPTSRFSSKARQPTGVGGSKPSTLTSRVVSHEKQRLGTMNALGRSDIGLSSGPVKRSSSVTDRDKSRFEAQNKRARRRRLDHSLRDDEEDVDDDDQDSLVSSTRKSGSYASSSSRCYEKQQRGAARASLLRDSRGRPRRTSRVSLELSDAEERLGQAAHFGMGAHIVQRGIRMKWARCDHLFKRVPFLSGLVSSAVPSISLEEAFAQFNLHASNSTEPSLRDLAFFLLAHNPDVDVDQLFEPLSENKSVAEAVDVLQIPDCATNATSVENGRQDGRIVAPAVSTGNEKQNCALSQFPDEGHVLFLCSTRCFWIPSSALAVSNEPSSKRSGVSMAATSHAVAAASLRLNYGSPTPHEKYSFRNWNDGRSSESTTQPESTPKSVSGNLMASSCVPTASPKNKADVTRFCCYALIVQPSWYRETASSSTSSPAAAEPLDSSVVAALVAARDLVRALDVTASGVVLQHQQTLNSHAEFQQRWAPLTAACPSLPVFCAFGRLVASRNTKGVPYESLLPFLMPMPRLSNPSEAKKRRSLETSSQPSCVKTWTKLVLECTANELLQAIDVALGIVTKSGVQFIPLTPYQIRFTLGTLHQRGRLAVPALLKPKSSVSAVQPKELLTQQQPSACSGSLHTEKAWYDSAIPILKRSCAPLQDWNTALLERWASLEEAQNSHFAFGNHHHMSQGTNSSAASIVSSAKKPYRIVQCHSHTANATNTFFDQLLRRLKTPLYSISSSRYQNGLKDATAFQAKRGETLPTTTPSFSVSAYTAGSVVDGGGASSSYQLPVAASLSPTPLLRSLSSGVKLLHKEPVETAVCSAEHSPSEPEAKETPREYCLLRNVFWDMAPLLDACDATVTERLLKKKSLCSRGVVGYVDSVVAEAASDLSFVQKQAAMYLSLLKQHTRTLYAFKALYIKAVINEEALPPQLYSIPSALSCINSLFLMASRWGRVSSHCIWGLCDQPDPEFVRSVQSAALVAAPNAKHELVHHAAVQPKPSETAEQHSMKPTTADTLDKQRLGGVLCEPVVPVSPVIRQLYGPDVARSLLRPFPPNSYLDVPLPPFAVSASRAKTCTVCFGGEWDPGNPIFSCTRCFTCVHKGCYAVPENTSDEENETFFCKRCDFEKRRHGSAGTASCAGSGDTFVSGSIRCECCNTLGGALKHTADGRWIHMTCALLLLPETAPGDVASLDYWDISGIQSWRRQLNCSVCSITDWKQFRHVGSPETKHTPCSQLPTFGLQGRDDPLNSYHLECYPLRLAEASPHLPIFRDVATCRGVCVVCSHAGCERAFHPLCAWMAGMYIEVQRDQAQFYPWTKTQYASLTSGIGGSSTNKSLELEKTAALLGNCAVPQQPQSSVTLGVSRQLDEIYFPTLRIKFYCFDHSPDPARFSDNDKPCGLSLHARSSGYQRCLRHRRYINRDLYPHLCCGPSGGSGTAAAAVSQPYIAATSTVENVAAAVGVCHTPPRSCLFDGDKPSKGNSLEKSDGVQSNLCSVKNEASCVKLPSVVTERSYRITSSITNKAPNASEPLSGPQDRWRQQNQERKSGVISENVMCTAREGSPRQQTEEKSDVKKGVTRSVCQKEALGSSKNSRSDLVYFPDKYCDFYCAVCFCPFQPLFSNNVLPQSSRCHGRNEAWKLEHCRRCGLAVHPICYGSHSFQRRRDLSASLHSDVFASSHQLAFPCPEERRTLQLPTQPPDACRLRAPEDGEENSSTSSPLAVMLAYVGRLVRAPALGTEDTVGSPLFERSGSTSSVSLNPVLERYFTCEACADCRPVDDVACLLCSRRGGALKALRVGRQSEFLTHSASHKEFCFALGSRSAPEQSHQEKEARSMPSDYTEQLKRWTLESYVHVTCALYCPNVTLGSSDWFHPIEQIDQVLSSAFYNTRCCHICSSARGVTLPCSYPGCAAFSHPLCLQQEGCFLERRCCGTPAVRRAAQGSEDVVNVDDEEGTVSALHIVNYCKKHSMARRHLTSTALTAVLNQCRELLETLRVRTRELEWRSTAKKKETRWYTELLQLQKPLMSVADAGRSCVLNGNYLGRELYFEPFYPLLTTVSKDDCKSLSPKERSFNGRLKVQNADSSVANGKQEKGCRSVLYPKLYPRDPSPLPVQQYIHTDDSSLLPSADCDASEHLAHSEHATEEAMPSLTHTSFEELMAAGRTRSLTITELVDLSRMLLPEYQRRRRGRPSAKEKLVRVLAAGALEYYKAQHQATTVDSDAVHSLEDAVSLSSSFWSEATLIAEQYGRSVQSIICGAHNFSNDWEHLAAPPSGADPQPWVPGLFQANSLSTKADDGVGNASARRDQRSPVALKVDEVSKTEENSVQNCSTENVDTASSKQADGCCADLTPAAKREIDVPADTLDEAAVSPVNVVGVNQGEVLVPKSDVQEVFTTPADADASLQSRQSVMADVADTEELRVRLVRRSQRTRRRKVFSLDQATDGTAAAEREHCLSKETQQAASGASVASNCDTLGVHLSVPAFLPCSPTTDFKSPLEGKHVERVDCLNDLPVTDAGCAEKQDAPGRGASAAAIEASDALARQSLMPHHQLCVAKDITRVEDTESASFRAAVADVPEPEQPSGDVAGDASLTVRRSKRQCTRRRSEKTLCEMRVGNVNVLQDCLLNGKSETQSSEVNVIRPSELESTTEAAIAENDSNFTAVLKDATTFRSTAQLMLNAENCRDLCHSAGSPRAVKTPLITEERVSASGLERGRVCVSSGEDAEKQVLCSRPFFKTEQATTSSDAVISDYVPHVPSEHGMCNAPVLQTREFGRDTKLADEKVAAVRDLRSRSGRVAKRPTDLGLTERGKAELSVANASNALPQQEDTLVNATEESPASNDDSGGHISHRLRRSTRVLTQVQTRGKLGALGKKRHSASPARVSPGTVASTDTTVLATDDTAHDILVRCPAVTPLKKDCRRDFGVMTATTTLNASRPRLYDMLSAFLHRDPYLPERFWNAYLAANACFASQNVDPEQTLENPPIVDTAWEYATGLELTEVSEAQTPMTYRDLDSVVAVSGVLTFVPQRVVKRERVALSRATSPSAADVSRRAVRILTQLRYAKNTSDIPLLSLAWVSEKNRRLFSRIFTRAMCGIIESFDELEVDLIQRLEAPDIVHIKQEDNVPKESSLWAAYSLCPAFQRAGHRSVQDGDGFVAENSTPTATTGLRSHTMTRKRASLTQALLESVFASFRDALLQFVRAAATEPPAACPSIPCWTFSHPNWSGALRTGVLAVGQRCRVFDVEHLLWKEALIVALTYSKDTFCNAESNASVTEGAFQKTSCFSLPNLSSKRTFSSRPTTQVTPPNVVEEVRGPGPSRMRTPPKSAAAKRTPTLRSRRISAGGVTTTPALEDFSSCSDTQQCSGSEDDLKQDGYLLCFNSMTSSSKTTAPLFQWIASFADELIEFETGNPYKSVNGGVSRPQLLCCDTSITLDFRSATRLDDVLVLEGTYEVRNLCLSYAPSLAPERCGLTDVAASLLCCDACGVALHSCWEAKSKHCSTSGDKPVNFLMCRNVKRINPAVEPETEKNNGPFYFALSKHEPDAIAFCNNAFLPNACSASLPQLTDASDDSSIQNDVMPPKYQMEFCARKICRSCVVNLQRQRNDLQNDAKHHQLVALNEDALWTSSLRNPQWMCSQCYAERSPYPSTSVAQLCVSPYVCPSTTLTLKSQKRCATAKSKTQEQRAKEDSGKKIRPEASSVDRCQKTADVVARTSPGTRNDCKRAAATRTSARRDRVTPQPPLQVYRVAEYHRSKQKQPQGPWRRSSATETKKRRPQDIFSAELASSATQQDGAGSRLKSEAVKKMRKTK